MKDEMTITEAADAADVHPRTLRRHIQRGTITATKGPEKTDPYIIDQVELRRWAQAELGRELVDAPTLPDDLERQIRAIVRDELRKALRKALDD